MSLGWRRTIMLASAFMAALAVAKWGGSWALNRYVSSRFGSQASTFSVNPLTLSASSRAGRASIGGVSVSWTELRVAIWGGKLVARNLFIGDELSPAATITGIGATHLFGTPVVRVKEVVLNPANALWRGLFNESGKSQASSAALPDFALWVEKFSANTAWGPVKGGLFIGDCQNGSGGRPFFVSFSAGQEAAGEFQGSWGKEGSVSGKVRFREGESQIIGGCKEGKWFLQSSLVTHADSWNGDLRGDEKLTRCILLQNSGDGNGNGWLYGAFSGLGAGAKAISNVRLLSSGITVPKMNLGSGWSLSGVKLHADNFDTDISNSAISDCFSLGASGILRSAGNGIMVPVEANLNWSGRGAEGLLVSASLGDGSDLPLENHLGHLGASVVVNGLSGAETSLQGSFQGNDFRGWAEGKGRSSQGEAHFGVAASSANGFANLTWGANGFSCQFGGRMLHEKGGDWPLPKGHWTFEGSASWVKGESLPTLLLKGREPARAMVYASFSGGRIEAQGAGLSLVSSWGAINGAAFSLNGVVDKGALRKAEVKARAEGAQIAGGPALGGINCDASLADGDISGKATISLPSLDGEVSTGFFLPKSDFSRLRIAGGTVNLLHGDLQLAGVEADGLSAWPKPAAVKAVASSLFGAESGPLHGSLSEGADGGIVVSGKGTLLGGEADLLVRPGEHGEVVVSGKKFDSSKLVKFVSRWAQLPFSAVSGPVDASVTIPLEGVPNGIKGSLEARKVTLDLGDERHQFRNAEGQIRFGVDPEATHFSSESLTLESGKLPLQIEGKSAGGVVTMDVNIPESGAAQVQNAFFDFLPEYVGFGTMAGGMGATAHLVSDARDKILTMILTFHGAEFASEDKALSLRGIEGSLPLTISLGLGVLPARRGFKAPDEKSVESAYGAYGAPIEKGAPLAIRSAAFSVYTMEDIGLSSALTEDGATDIRISRGRLWDGGVHGEFRVGMSSNGLGYSGQLLFKDVSLRDLCNQAGGLTGFIGGRLSGHVTFGADKFGLAALKMVAGFSVDPAGDEPMVIGRDFLVKIGGAQMKRLVPTRFLNYDKAQIGFAVRSGSLTVSKLVLEHEANPIKSILRKDISFEIRVPFNNSISIYQLLDSIKGLQERSATVQ